MHECAICMETCCKDVYWLKCNHCFHGKCIRELIAYGGKKCPLCRRELSDLNEKYKIVMMRYDSLRGQFQQGKLTIVFSKLLELAEMGCVSAQYDLGVLYLNGEGVEQRIDEGVKWIRLAATESFPDAEHRLGVLYSTGIGCKKNEFKARSWFLRAGRSERLTSAFSANSGEDSL